MWASCNIRLPRLDRPAPNALAPYAGRSSRLTGRAMKRKESELPAVVENFRRVTGKTAPDPKRQYWTCSRRKNERQALLECGFISPATPFFHIPPDRIRDALCAAQNAGELDPSVVMLDTEWKAPNALALLGFVLRQLALLRCPITIVLGVRAKSVAALQKEFDDRRVAVILSRKWKYEQVVAVDGTKLYLTFWK